MVGYEVTVINILKVSKMGIFYCLKSRVYDYNNVFHLTDPDSNPHATM